MGGKSLFQGLNGVLMSKVCSEIVPSLQREHNVIRCYYWTDSAIVHCWVMDEEKLYKPYVQKRLQKIRDVITNHDEWKLVTSKSNPADIATRGLTPYYLANSEMWFYGPEFLKSELKQLEHLDVILNPDTNSEGLENYIRSTNNLCVLQGVKSEICLTDSYDIVKTVNYDGG